MARSFAEAARKHMGSRWSSNKPGASGLIGFTQIACATTDGYKVAVLTAELPVIPHTVALKSMAEPVLMEALDKLNLHAAFAAVTALKNQMIRDSETLRVLVETLKLKN